MNRVIQISVEESTCARAAEILEEIGLDIEAAVRMCLKKIARRGEISFLLPEERRAEGEAAGELPSDAARRGRMTKSRAKFLFSGAGEVLGNNITFSSKNRSGEYYWGNPNFSVLTRDWHLILNDVNARKLYLFSIPAGSIGRTALKPRADKHFLIDLQILYGDDGFTDRRSGVRFRPFLVRALSY